MQIAVCDDDTAAGKKCAQEIKAFLAHREDALGRVRLYQEVAPLLADYRAGVRFDAIFLDIEMPRVSGLEAAEVLRELDCEAPIIFVTAYPDYMPASFQVEAFDFLIKPVSAQALRDVLLRCARKREKQCGHIVVKTASGSVPVTLDQVVFVKSNLHYVDFVLRGESMPLRSKLKLDAVEALLMPYAQFARCHQSYIINLDDVQELAGSKLLLTVPGLVCSDTLPISRKYTASVEAAFLRRNLIRGRDS